MVKLSEELANKINILKYIQERIHTHVIHMVKLSEELANKINILKYIQERIHTHVIHMVKLSEELANKINILTHTGKKPYACDTYGKAFPRISKLKPTS